MPDTAPLPPPDIAERELPIWSEPGNDSAPIQLWRITGRKHNPIFFGPAEGDPPAGRWDSPDGSYRVLYAATSIRGAFAETALRSLDRFVVDSWAAERSLIDLSLKSDALRLVQFSGEGLAKLGATGAVVQGPYSVTRAWSRALHDHPVKPDGLIYRCRHDDDERAVALFDRAAGRIGLGPLALQHRISGNRLQMPSLLVQPQFPDLLDHYQLGLVADPALDLVAALRPRYRQA